jgi:hypothetical protein
MYINHYFSSPIEGKLVMREVTELDPHWLFEIAPHFFKDVRKE